MVSDNIPNLSVVLHELAEGLHSTGNYLSALRRVARSDARDRTSRIDMIEKALDELGRSRGAFKLLRAQLLVYTTEEAKPAATHGPTTWKSPIGQR